MSYVKPDAVLAQLVQAGVTKASLPVQDLLIRGALSGALLGFATTLALTASVQTTQPIVGGLIFPVGFVMIVLLGLELVTGNFAVVPLAVLEGKAPLSRLLNNWGWVFLGNLLGSLLYALLFSVAIPHDSPIAKQIMTVAQAKTLGYAQLGSYGMLSVFVKAMLCNWMVTLGVVMAFTSQSTAGKIVAMWLPILTFFAQGFEHSVVNMFVIPTGMLLGAPVSVGDWWLWNQIPVTLGNIVGGFLFTGLALYLTYRPAPAPAAQGEAAHPVTPPLSVVGALER
jgi:formate/nitrite transporter